jgi:hypothetical protein
VCGIDEVVDVTLPVSHGRLIGRKTPIAIYNELVLMYSSLKGLEESELISANLVHWQALAPFCKAAYQKGLVSSKVPCEHNVD